jgi:hypothetical protein
VSWRPFAAWLPMVPLAILNGVLRERLLARRLPSLRAHQLSTLTLAALLAAYVALVSRWLELATARQAWVVGLLWVALTVAFEFLFGRLVVGKPWSELFADYDLAAGHLWPLFLGWLLVLPWLVYRLQG